MSISKVKVINYINPSNFAIIIDDDGILDKQLTLIKPEGLRKPVLQKDVHVLCFDTQDNKWLRGSYIGNSGTATNSLMISHYLDQPGVFTCAPEHVYKLPETLNSRSLFIKDCTIDSGHTEWSPNQIQRFQSIINSASLTAEIFYAPQSNFIRLFANDRNILNLLNESGAVLTSGKCHVLSAKSADEVYILTHPMKSKLNFINESLTYMNAMSMPMVDNLKEAKKSDSMLVCYNSEVDAWYRSKIVKLIDNSSAEVFYVDCGITMTVKNSPQSMRLCSMELASYEPSATLCAYDSDKPSSKWTADDLNILKSSIEGKVLYVKVIDKSGDRPLVKFLNPNDNKKEMFQFPVVFYPYRRGCFDGEGYIVYYKMNAHNRATEIFVQLKSDMVLSDIIEDRLSKYDKKRSMPLKKPRVGDLCVVVYEDLWYRASIQSISSANIPVYLVHLVDYGEFVEVSTVYTLHNSLLNAYPLAIKGSLYKHATLSEDQIQLIKTFADNQTRLLIRFIPDGDSYTLRLLDENNVDQFPPEHSADVIPAIPVYPSGGQLNNDDSGNTSSPLYSAKLLYRPILPSSTMEESTMTTTVCYIQLSSQEENESKINSILQSCEKLEMIPYGSDLVGGGACLVEMNEWLYRAVIVKSEAEVNLITVNLVDSGYSKSYKREEVFQLPADLIGIPPLAVGVTHLSDDPIFSVLREPGCPILFEKSSDNGNVFVKGVLGLCVPRYKEILFETFQGRVVHISKDVVFVVPTIETAPLLNSDALQAIPDDYLVMKNFDCVVQMPNSNDCARARITYSVSNAEHPYTAFLLDRGQSIPVSRDQLRLLPSHLYGAPPVAIACRFPRQVTLGESILCQIVTVESGVHGIMELTLAASFGE